MSTPLADIARRWIAAGRPAIVVTVSATRGSAPREAGTCMLVAADAVEGTIGGGHLEWQAIADARGLLAAGAAPPRPGDTSPAPAPLREQHLALGPSLGQCCGGAVSLRFEWLTAAQLERWPAAVPRFHLQLYGAGHVGRAIVVLLSGIECRVQWIDERDLAFAPPAPDRPWPAHIECLAVEPVQAEVALAPPGSCFLVMTHSHDLDMAITEAILRRGDFHFFGLIGSRTKRARFRSRLAHKGFAPGLIDRITCPIGIDGIDGKEPEVLAVAVVAQLLQLAPSRPGRVAADR